MENEYDLKNIKFFIKDNYILIENEENTLVFIVFHDRNINKRRVLFKEITSNKLTLKDIIMIKNIIKNLYEDIDDYEGV